MNTPRMLHVAQQYKKNEIMNRFYKYLIVLPLFAACLLVFNAQDIRAQSDNKAFRYFTPHEGFPSFVFRMAQGDDGEIWMTGPSGLVSFDGYETHVYTHDPTYINSIPEGPIYELLNDKNGHLWLIGPNGVALYDFHTGGFSEVSIPDSLPTFRYRRGMGLIQTADSLIWIASVDGIYKLSIPTLERPKPDVIYFGIDELEGDGKSARDIIEGPDGQLWIGSDEGLYFLNPETGSYTKAGPFNQVPDGVDSYSFMVMDGDKTVWVSLNGGLLRFAEGEKEPEFLTTLGEKNFSLAGIAINSMTLTSDGSIWIATGASGALQFHPSTNILTQFKSDAGNGESIFENTVFDILEDMDGNIWFGHAGNGMSMMYHKAWNYTFKKIIDTDDPTALSNSISGIEPDADDNLWVATPNGLTFVPADGGPNQIFLPDSKGSASNTQSLYFSTLFAGEDILFLINSNTEEGDRLHRFDRKEKRFTGVVAMDSLSSSLSFMFDGRTLYWSARVKNTLRMLDAGDLSTTSIDLPLAFPLPDNADSTIYFNPFVSKSGDLYLQYNYAMRNENSISKRIYFKLDTELQSFSEVSLRSPESQHSLKMSRRTIASQLQEGVFWTLTNNGLLKEDVIKGTSSLIISESVSKNFRDYFLLEDQQGNIWYSDYNSNIYKIDPLTQREQAFVLDVNRKPTRIWTGAQLSGGDIIVGGQGGYIQFNPADIREELNIQKLYIDEFRAGTTTYTNLQPGMEYEIEYDDNNISFSYLGINFRPGNIRYRYRLLGYNDQWIDLGSQRSIFFANLPFGSYNFQLQATKSGTSFSENSATAEVQFTILPPWWRTTFAYVIYILLFGGFIFGIDRIQRKRVLQKERERATARELEQAKEIEKAYNDLEKAHQNLEDAHENLKSAQSQLIQSEKMASLGELTAGIAHEIQNPLNFVNNFSELSNELIDEVEEERAKNPESRDENLVSEVLSDIKQNLEKINHHGKRAADIVKGMLQHSRNSSGVKEPTDINALADEYLRLAYHGLRAKDKSFNADFKTEFYESLPKINVIPQDIGRVLLNLINNAFYAVSSKTSMEDKNYKPIVTVSTKINSPSGGGKGEETVQITVSDNGPGIPDSIKDKIFQPFFTTKPTGLGTGLGLSLSYDIVKAHGGEIKVESKEGKGTDFFIILPI